MSGRRIDVHTTVLLVDGDAAHESAFRRALLDPPHHMALRLERVPTLAEALARLAHPPVWAVFVSLTLPDAPGLAALDALIAAAPDTPIAVLAGRHDDALGRSALMRGASDYLLEGHIEEYDFARALRQIDEREEARRALFIEQDRAQVTLNSIGDAVLSVDVAGHVTYLNVMAERMTGWSCQQALGQPLARIFRIVDSVTRTPARDPLALAMQLDKAVGLSANSLLIRRDGHETAIEDSSAPIHDRDGRISGAVIVFHDVGHARAMVAEMTHLAQHDVLTNLPNRLLLRERLSQAVLLAQRNQGHVAVLYLDIDGFKRVNDSLGHAVGDRLLQSVASRLSASVRRSDTVSRLGGDEFVVMLPVIAHAADAVVAADKLLAELRRPHDLDQHRVHVTASVGIATYPDHGDDVEALLKNADTAMYHAKEHGRDTFRGFDRAMSLRAVERQSLEGQLRYAVQDNELRLHYQPKVNLQTGAITSVEALVRWQHPERGLLMPAQFLSVAEESGVIVGLGQWALREACAQTRAWIDQGLRAVPVAVNVSSLEFRGEHFIENVRDALAESRLDPTYLELELTETVLMRHAESAARDLDTLRAMGVRVAIDDFGTGYSSLSYLTQFRIDTLKLDRSFMPSVGGAPGAVVVVGAIIDMARHLNHRVIAEGVETAEQLSFLREHGCEEGQGYYFSHPVPAPQLADLLERRSSAPLGTRAPIHADS